MHKHAFVTFVMMNDKFVPGALVFAHAIKKQKINADLICMITPEVSKNAKTTLKLLYDDVITVDPISIHHHDRQKRQDRPFLFTKLQALRLGKDGDLNKGYEKIIIADADILPISDYESLFDIKAPAGILNEHKHHCVESNDGKYIKHACHHQSSTWQWHYIYRSCPHGFTIPKKITDRIMYDKNNLGVNVCLCRIDPSMIEYNAIINDLKNPSTLQMVSIFPWPEMQYLTLRYSGLWHNIDIKYASFNGYPNLDILHGTHYAGQKPWQINNPSVKHYAKYKDYQLFFRSYIEMIQSYPELNKYIKLNQLYTTFKSWLIA
jgi:glycogenin glucosyltransferase